MKRHVSILLWVLLIVVQAASAAGLKARIDSLIKSRPEVTFSICVIKANSGRPVYTHHARRPMIPASNMKIITSATALHYLGPDFEYVTRVGLMGDTLIVIGSGDPLLGDRDVDRANGRAPGWIMADIANKLRQSGRERIQDLIIDSTVFDDQRVHPHWPESELNRAYSAEVCGLNYNGNCISVTVRNTGGRIVIDIGPQTGFIDISNQVRRIASGEGAVGAYRKTGTPNALLVKGTCRKQQGPFDVAIEQPAVFFGYVLAEQLGASGIAVSGQLVERALDPDIRFQRLVEYRTPLVLCMQRCNKDSFNLAAEALFKSAAAYGTSPPSQGSWPLGQQRVQAFLAKLGLADSEYHIDDGSGLSRENRLTAHVITTVLRSLYRGRHWNFYSKTLAQAGIDGTLEEDFEDTKYQGRIIGKSGYLTGVRALSGLARTDNGDLIFSILANKASGVRRLVCQMAQAIIDCN